MQYDVTINKGNACTCLYNVQSFSFARPDFSEKTCQCHYNVVIMSSTASQITGLTIVCSTLYSSTDQRKHQSSASLAFVRGIHRWPVNSPHKGPVTRKMFPFDDVIMACQTLIADTLALYVARPSGATVIIILDGSLLSTRIISCTCASSVMRNACKCTFYFIFPKMISDRLRLNVSSWRFRCYEWTDFPTVSYCHSTRNNSHFGVDFCL